MKVEVEDTAAESRLVPHRIPSLVSEANVNQRSWKFVLLGNFDLSYFFFPLVLYSKNAKGKHHLRFSRSHEYTPLLLNVFLGLQMACILIYGIMGPAHVLRTFFATLPNNFNHYAFQSSVIIAGIASILNSLEVAHPLSPFQLGTGLLSPMVTAPAFSSVFIGNMYDLMLTDGLSPHVAYGRMICTIVACSPFFILITCIPRRIMKRLIPPLLSGLILILLGLQNMIIPAKLWGGGVFCEKFLDRGVPCGDNGNVQLLFGSAQFLGIGLLVIVLYLCCEMFGTPFMRHNILTFSVLSVFFVSCFFTESGHHYVTGDKVDDIPPLAFLWTTTYKLKVHNGAVIPLFGAFFVTYLQATAVLTGTLEESKMDIAGWVADKKIAGGLIMTSVFSFFATLATGFPVMPAAASNSVIAITKQSSKSIAASTGIWFLLFGIFGKLLGIYMEIIPSIFGSVGVLLFGGVVLTGMKILGRETLNRRMFIISIMTLAFGCMPLLVPHYIANIWQDDATDAGFVRTFRFTVKTVLGEPCFVGGFVGILLNALLPADMSLDDENDVMPEAYEPVYDS